MKSRTLVVVGTVMYVVSWFLPTYSSGMFYPFADTITGWQAFRIALSAFGPPWYATVLGVASALSNVVIVGALTLVFMARRSPPRFLRAMLVASAVLNTHWFVLETYTYRSTLRIGYYLWASSFFVIAAGLILEGRRSGSRRAPAG